MEKQMKQGTTIQFYVIPFLTDLMIMQSIVEDNKFQKIDYIRNI